MADLSSADNTYMAAMVRVHKAAGEIVRTYLAASPGDRNAKLSEMARMTIKDHADEEAKMAEVAKTVGRRGSSKSLPPGAG